MFKSKNLWQYLIPSLLLIGVVAFDCAQPVSAAYLTGGIGYWSNNGTSIYYNNGNIGIGTTAPATLLHVNGTGATVDAMELITAFTSTRSRFAYWDPASPDTKIAFGSGWGVATDFAVHTKTSGNFSKSTQRFTVKNNGNVGIGTTNPSVKLEVVGTNDHAPLKISRDSNDKQIGISYYPAGALSNSNKGWMMGLEENSNDFSFYNWNGSDPINNILYLTNTNNVGVGSTTPVSKLAVNGLIKMPYYTISAPEDVVNVSYLNSTLSTFNTNNNLWKLNGNDLYASSTTWNIGIGTTSAGTYKLAVNGASRFDSGNFVTDGAGNIVAESFVDKSNGIYKVDPSLTTTAINVAGTINSVSGVLTTSGTGNNYMAGKLGIGVVSPNGKVAIAQNMSDYTTAFTAPHLKLDASNTVDNTGFVGITYSGSTSANYGWSVGSLRSTNGLSSFVWKQHNNSATGTELMRIMPNGKVGIGTNNPGTSLQIGSDATNPTILLESTASGDNNTAQSAGIEFGETSGARGSLWYTGDGYMHLGMNNRTREHMRFKYNATQTWMYGDIYFPGSGIWNSSGSVGVGSTTPVSKLAVNGLIKMPYYTISAPEDVVNVSYLNSTLSTFNTNNNLWKLNGNDLYASSTTWNVGIGTTNPLGLFNLAKTTNSGGPQIFIQNTSSDDQWVNQPRLYGEIVFSDNDADNVRVDKRDAVIKAIPSHNYGGQSHLTFSTASSHTDSDVTERMRITNTGNVGIGTTNPGTYKLSVNGTGNFTGTVSVATPTAGGHAATKAYVDDVVFAGTSTSAYVRKTGDTMTGNLDMGGNSISGINKISVGTIDPLYDIRGIKYSTFASAIAGGVKEEYIGQGQIKKCNSQSCYWYLDFDQIEEGSDSWVWRQTVDFRPEKVEVLMTAQGLPTPLSYEFKDNGIIFHAERPTKFSYRLIGARFDWRKWPTKALDQNEKASLTIK